MKRESVVCVVCVRFVDSLLFHFTIEFGSPKSKVALTSDCWKLVFYHFGKDVTSTKKSLKSTKKVVKAGRRPGPTVLL